LTHMQARPTLPPMSSPGASKRYRMERERREREALLDPVSPHPLAEPGCKAELGIRLEKGLIL